MNSSQFMQALPGAARPHLPPELRKFRTQGRSWLMQLYYRDPYLHYEAWNLGRQRGLLELGLHFESRDRATNRRYLYGFQRSMFEVKSALGMDWEAEPWDKGWSKVYTVLELPGFSQDYLDRVARDLAQAITVLQPIFEEI
jgi:hypothetical protein